MENFTPLAGLTGGLLIGLSAALLLFLNGRIAGISGILGGLLAPASSEFLWRGAFVIGLLAAPLLYQVTLGAVAIQTDASTAVLVVAGLLVGFGTRLGSGCTSGHGICGIGRLAPRSLAATAIFMTTAIVTVWVTRHLLGA